MYVKPLCQIQFISFLLLRTCYATLLVVRITNMGFELASVHTKYDRLITIMIPSNNFSHYVEGRYVDGATNKPNVDFKITTKVKFDMHRKSLKFPIHKSFIVTKSQNCTVNTYKPYKHSLVSNRFGQVVRNTGDVTASNKMSTSKLSICMPFLILP